MKTVNIRYIGNLLMSQVCAHTTRVSTLLLSREDVVLDQPEYHQYRGNNQDEIE